MALGNNLKKKQLIPDPVEDQKTNQVDIPKKSTSRRTVKKKEVEPSNSPTKKLEEVKSKKLIAKNSKSTSKQSKVKKTSKKKTPTKEVEEEIIEVSETKVQSTEAEVVLESVDISSVVYPDQKKEDFKSNHEQIISAYSVYIAQELYERKKVLRKKYIEEITNLQGKPIQFILLTIGSERYALDIDCVKEVVPLPTISQTPNTPNHIKGVVNVRGNTYAVYDLTSKFEVVGQEVPRYLLVLSNRELKSSIPLSVLPTTFKTNGSQISYSLQTIENVLLDASYIKGMIQDNDELIYYLDIEELLKNDKAIVIPDNLVEEK